jgi:hypothetical protein
MKKESSSLTEELYWKRMLEQYSAQQLLILQTPWAVGFRDRGMGHGDYGVVTEDDALVCPCDSKEVAEHICELHNATLKGQHVRVKKHKTNNSRKKRLKDEKGEGDSAGKSR